MDKDDTMWNQHALPRCAVLGLGAFGMTLLSAVGPAPAATVGAAPPASAAFPPVPFASRDAAAVVEPSAPNAWGGARTGNEPTLSDRVVGYAIQAALDPVKHTVDGHETLTWRNRSDRAIDALYLHLYLNAFEGNGSTFFTERNRPGFEFRSGVKIEDGQWGHIELRKVEQGGTSARVSFVHPDGGPPTDHTVVRIDLPTAVPPGGSTTLDISFLDQLPRVIARTGYFGTFHLVGQWYPKIGVLELPGERGATAVRWNVHEFHLHSEFYADYGTFDVHLTVPKGYTVGATGEELEAPVENGALTTHHFIQNDVHEFAWTADSRTAAPLEGSYEGPGSPKVRVKILFPPEYASNAAPALKATIDSLAYFSQTVGPYPYKTVTVVVPPYNADEAGGMEYPTFFTVSGFKDVTPNTLMAIALDFVTIHEFGHGYFYGILGSNEFEEPMLDEGINEFWDMRMLRARHQDAHLTTPGLKRIGIDPVFTGFEFEHLTAGLNHPADGVGENSWNRLSTESYGTVYSRTATMMHDLEQRIGTPALEKAMKAYYERWKFRHPSIADLRESLAEASPDREAVDTAFKRQVYAATKIDDSVDDLESKEVLPEPGTRFVDGKWPQQTQEAVDADIKKQRDDWKKAHPDAAADSGPFPYRTTVTVGRHGAAVPEKLVVHFADGSNETVMWNDEHRWQRYSWVKSVRGVSAVLDPDDNHMLDANRLNNSRITDAEADGGPAAGFLRRALRMIAGGPASRSWNADFEAMVQSVWTLVSTL